MRPNVLLALGSLLTLAGCTALTDFQGYGSDGVDAAGSDGGPRDAGEALDAGDVDASVSDAGPRDGGSDAGPRPGCMTLTASSPIGLGAIDGLPTPVTNAVYDVAFDPAGGLAVAWITTARVGRAGAWTVDRGAASAEPRFPVRDAVLDVDTSGGSIHLGWSAAMDWLVLGQRGLGYRATACGMGGCNSATGPTAQSPFAIAQRPGDFVLVHTLDANWAASTWAGSTTALERTPSSLIPFDAIATEAGHVMLAEVDVLGDSQTAFVWFGQPPAVGYELSSSSLEAVNAMYVAYDASTDRAIGVVSELDAPITTHLLIASATDPTPIDVVGWTGNPGPVVARGDGTFLVRASSTTYELRAVSSPGDVLDTVDAPGDSSKPVIVDGEYAIVSIHPGDPRQLALRIYACE